MSDKPFLHDHPRFTALLDAVAARTEIAVQLVEKDYWLMHVLWAIKNSELRFELKGGTSLSKGWKIIDRFSEDVDIKIFEPQGMTVYAGKNHSKPRHRESRERYFLWLLSVLKIPGAIYLNRDSDFDDHDLRNAGYRVGYQTNYSAQLGIKTDVLLEVGFDTTTPNESRDISSWAYDYAVDNKLEIQDNRAVAVPCYFPEYTLVEKLSAISKKYRQEVEGKDVKNFTRHYYDVYQLLGESRVQAFLGTKDYLTHKESRFGKNDESDISKNKAFSLPDPKIRSKFAERLERSSGLYYRGQPSLDEIIDRIQAFAERL